MTRSNHRGLFDRLVQLPWPAGIVFGLLGFAAVRWGLAWVSASIGGEVDAAFAKAAATGVIAMLAWLPLLFGAVASGLSFWRAGGRREQRDREGKQQSVQALTWVQFERLVSETYRRRGYLVESAGELGVQDGADLLLKREGVTTLVNCRLWRAKYVGVSAIREFGDLMAQRGVDEGKILCAGVFSSDCYRFAVGKPIELIDGEMLHRLLAHVRADMPVLGMGEGDR